MNPKEKESRVSDFKLERFLLGELGPGETLRLQREIDHDVRLRERVEELKRSNEEVLERYPPPWMASEVRRRVESSGPLPGRDSTLRRRLRFRPITALAVAAAALVVLLLLPPPTEWGGRMQEQHPSPDGIRVKGSEPRLLLFRKTETGSEKLENGATARKHDLILIQYDAAGMAYGVIFSVDGRGSMTRHHPLEGSKPVPLRQDGPVSLDFSYELDDAPDWEKFYFVTSDSSFDPDVVFGALEEVIINAPAVKGDSLRLPPHLRQTVFTLEKEAGHE